MNAIPIMSTHVTVLRYIVVSGALSTRYSARGVVHNIVDGVHRAGSVLLMLCMYGVLE